MPTVKIKVRQKNTKIESFNQYFLDNFPPLFKKIKISNHFGIVTACNNRLFIGLQMLVSSIVYSYDIKVLVYDVGLTPLQVDWLKRQPNIYVKLFELPPYKPHLSYPEAWFKPHYIRSSPFKNTIWIDADAIVLGDLRELIDYSHPRALFTSDHTSLRASTVNQPMLYEHLPLGGFYNNDIEPYINTGVLVINAKRDNKILEDWCFCVDQACVHKHIADSILCWDQGACKWALHKNNLLYLIVPDKKFNYPAKVRHFAYPASAEAVIYWMKHTRPEDKCTILHWMGSPKPWFKWNYLELDLSMILKK